MDNERPNERTLWSSRLEEPGALPGTGLTDKEAAWDKLYDRLRQNVRKTGRRGNVARFPERSDNGPSSDLLRHGPPRSGPTVLDNEPVVRFEEAPRRRRMIWLWTTAACLLLLIIPVALLLRDGHKGSRQRIPPIPLAINPGKEHTTPQDKLPSHQPVAINPTQPGRREEVGPAQREEIIPLRQENIEPAHGKRPDPNKDIAYAHPASSQQARPALSQQAHPTPGQQLRPPVHPTRPDLNKLLAHGDDTLTLVLAPRPDLSKPLTVTVTAPPKKVPRVVHINELEPLQPTPSMVKGPRQKAGGLHIGLVPQETFRPSTSYTEPDAHSILLLNHTQNP